MSTGSPPNSGANEVALPALVLRVGAMSDAAIEAAIEASHPERLETDDAYAADGLAMDLIHGRHDKREIVNLIRWLLLGAQNDPSHPPT